MRQVRAAIIAALFIPGALSGLLLPTRAEAQDVTLRSRDGGIELSGTMLGFDGEFYRIDSRYGELTVDSSGVLCEGVGCPSLTDFVAELRISGATSLGALLMPALIESFAQRNGYGAEPGTLAGGGTRYALTDGEREIGHFDITPSRTETTACAGKGWISSTLDSHSSARSLRMERAGFPVKQRVRIVSSSCASTIAAW